VTESEQATGSKEQLMAKTMGSMESSLATRKGSKAPELMSGTVCPSTKN
jgi:hypothetical protein